MRRKSVSWWILAGLWLTAALLVSCAGASQTISGQEVDAIYTQAAQTLGARLTLEAGNTAIAMLTQLVQRTPTPRYTVSPLPPTTHTPQPPTDTSAPPTITPLPCDGAEFIGDVSIPEGTVFSPGVTFTKTWRVQNIGSCTWTTAYAWIYYSGDLFEGTVQTTLLGDVPPGSTVDISVPLVSPSQAGTYTEYWMLRNASGTLFGAGPAANTPFSVKIQVTEGETIEYDIAKDYCQATWVNSSTTLGCPTTSQDENVGFVYRDDSPRLETGDVVNKPTLVTHPDGGTQSRYSVLGEQGIIAGIFPSLRIDQGERFKATIGCLYGYTDCNALIFLLAQMPDGSQEILGSWQELYDGQVTEVDVPLDSLAGQNVNLILVVQNNGSATDDYAFWKNPRLVR